jgi:iron(III) transport system substrate-binding protein
MEALLSEYIDRVVDPLLNPQKRVFWGYLTSALFVALFVQLFIGKATIFEAISGLFKRSVWWSKSARIDYLILIVNQAVMMGALPRLVSKLAVATIVFEALHIWFDGRVIIWPEAPGWIIASTFTVSLFILDDGAKYVVHRALHHWPVLWCFHKIHHSAETLTPFTVYRTHPIEGLVFGLRAILVQATSAAGFLYFFGDRAELVTLLGVNAGLFLFNAAGANLRHSHVWISYGRSVECFLISPAQHQIHHSVEVRHRDCNFGAVLAIWDWLAGSLYRAEDRPPRRFGLFGEPARSYSMTTIYLTPIVEAFRYMHPLLIKGFTKMPAQVASNSVRQSAVGGIVFCLCFAVFGSSAAGAELNIYSHRQPFLIKPFIDAYEAKTSTKINIVYASKGLAQRLQAEGSRSPADIILTVDMARLNVYADKGLLAPVKSEILTRNVPKHLRDPRNTWFAFSKRARVIVIAKRAEDTASITRYEDLADPKWRGRICARPGSHVYNRALIASMINAEGAVAAENWAEGLMENLARRPQGNDRAQVKAIYEGVCDISIINNYYFGKLKYSDKPAQRSWAAAVRLIFPNQKDRGTHVNISGGGVAKHSKHKAEAIRFLEFLTSQAAQDLYGSVNYEYPVNPAVEIPAELRSWGSFSEDKMPIGKIADLAPDAQKVIDRVGW